MENFPGKTQITIEGRKEKEGINTVYIGYKYNKSSIFPFVMMRVSEFTK